MENAQRKLDRKTIERNRRIHMKGLISKLSSLVPPQHFRPSKEMLSQQDQIDQVAAYIKQLKERVEELENRKKLATTPSDSSGTATNSTTMRFPLLNVRDIGSSLEVVLVSGTKKNFALSELIKILESEGTEVVSTSISTIGSHVFHILHAQVKVSRFGVDASMICDRLQALIC